MTVAKTQCKFMAASRPVDSALVDIGMNFAGKAKAHADIETTVVHASSLGMDEDDLRALSPPILFIRTERIFEYQICERVAELLPDNDDEGCIVASSIAGHCGE